MRESAWYMTISLVETLLVSVHPHWVSAIHAVVSSPLSPSSHSSLPLRSLLPLIIPLLQGSSNLIPEPHSKSTQINQFLGPPTRGLGKSCACLETIISELPPPLLVLPRCERDIVGILELVEIQCQRSYFWGTIRHKLPQSRHFPKAPPNGDQRHTCGLDG